jgi:hypothetical protein
MSFVPAITLSQALTDPQLFGEICAAPSFWTWRTVAKVVDGGTLTEPREIVGSTTPNPFHCDVGSDVGRVSGIRAHKTKKPMMATTANPRNAIALPKWSLK